MYKRQELDEYDLILTGDLSKYGSEVFIEIMKEFSYTIGGNYDDAGKMLYDIKNQEVFAGGSGCGCISLVAMGYVVDCLKKGIYNKVCLLYTSSHLDYHLIHFREQPLKVLILLLNLKLH